jgi:hypothetical protein
VEKFQSQFGSVWIQFVCLSVFDNLTHVFFITGVLIWISFSRVRCLKDSSTPAISLQIPSWLQPRSISWNCAGDGAGRRSELAATLCVVAREQYGTSRLCTLAASLAARQCAIDSCKHASIAKGNYSCFRLRERGGCTCTHRNIILDFLELIW